MNYIYFFLQKKAFLLTSTIESEEHSVKKDKLS